MKKISFYFFLLLNISSFAQDLVTNPSFEIYDMCPNALTEIDYAVGWNNVGGSPDYFNACASSTSDVSVPSNIFGYHYAASGKGYAGFWAKDESSGYREYLGSQLIAPLQIGTMYYVSIKVSLAASDFEPSEYCGVNKLGVLFSTINYAEHYPAPENNYAQVYTDSIITDTLNWVSIKGSFVADSAYSFISIGLFFTDSLIDTTQVAGSLCQAYYYLDDICVSTDSSYCSDYSYTGLTNINKSDFFNCYPNPAIDFITIEDNENNIETIKLYDINGQLLRNQESNHSHLYTLNLINLSKGIYNLMIVRKNLILTNQIIIKL